MLRPWTVLLWILMLFLYFNGLTICHLLSGINYKTLLIHQRCRSLLGVRRLSWVFHLNVWRKKIIFLIVTVIQKKTLVIHSIEKYSEYSFRRKIPHDSWHRKILVIFATSIRDVEFRRAHNSNSWLYIHNIISSFIKNTIYTENPRLSSSGLST